MENYTNSVNGYIRSKAREILENLTNNEIEKCYSSHLKEYGGFLPFKLVKKGVFSRNGRYLDISDEYASQVFYRYTLKEICALLNVYKSVPLDDDQIIKTEEYINLYKNVENIYNRKKDDSSFDEMVKDAVNIILSSLKFNSEKEINLDAVNTHSFKTLEIASIKDLSDVKKQKFSLINERIKIYLKNDIRR